MARQTDRGSPVNLCLVDRISEASSFRICAERASKITFQVGRSSSSARLGVERTSL
jgi:hypothetical protein